MAEAASLIASWLTPCCLFIFVNLVIATIAISCRFKTQVLLSPTTHLLQSHSLSITPNTHVFPSFYQTARVGCREDEEVDAKADDFINRFKKQLRLQRIDSLLRYRGDMTYHRGKGGTFIGNDLSITNNPNNQLAIEGTSLAKVIAMSIMPHVEAAISVDTNEFLGASSALLEHSKVSIVYASNSDTPTITPPTMHDTTHFIVVTAS
ncbi:hypothetical protein VNO78_23007 [Psophocarpus tetragonolobus]|uniref:DUF4408 domain-containing protein n=1 Tax=Psophocarpus tetragonolobus TaxID=3891 RepID=A0AAN9XCQ7_PSOTE